MPPEAATADILPSCTSVAMVSADSWFSSQRPQVEARPEWPACLTSWSPQCCFQPLPLFQPTSPDSGDPCSELGDGMGRLCTH